MKENETSLGVARITELFTRDGRYLCARWGRPVAPVIFGLSDESLAIFREATRAVYHHAGHPLAETDPEMGANMMTFFLRGWDELAGVPDLDRLTGRPDLPARLRAQGADQYRLFRFDPDGAIRVCISFVNMGGRLADAHPGQLAETIAVRSTLTFACDVVPGPQLAVLIRAAYDPVLPKVAQDPSHALRLAARLAN
ncbi:hypothetical protein SAMN04487972_102230 [Paracoccus halophilus]|uniref:Uncharacterized protein n=1 Tax=Paracoccus halophilus TaxID=376733 RepID=A0A099F9F4_9RHOB|nr:hypothetical protein [Paracoccus halophilus]KGJ06717.1 hypothetical protein IT41_00640 [Paracoccus halophilus]SFA42030.1 hypothetical protein SAMN04487972_102230 [Paracoccus halophilus]